VLARFRAHGSSVTEPWTKARVVLTTLGKFAFAAEEDKHFFSSLPSSDGALIHELPRLLLATLPSQ
jgi:hypothetical protein